MSGTGGRYSQEIEDDWERRHYPERYRERKQREYDEQKRFEDEQRRRSEEQDRWERQHSGGGQGVYS